MLTQIHDQTPDHFSETCATADNLIECATRKPLSDGYTETLFLNSPYLGPYVRAYPRLLLNAPSPYNLSKGPALPTPQTSEQLLAFHHEHVFNTVCRTIISPSLIQKAADEFTETAENCIEAVCSPNANFLQDADPNLSWGVFALGKLGACEMTASSDLDLMLIYDCDEDGDPQAAQRVVRDIIASLSNQNAGGDLYDVDLDLRPYGKAGYSAVQSTLFSRYYETSAWTWELMALTRLRPIAGNNSLCHRISSAASDIIAKRAPKQNLRTDILEMRDRVSRFRSAKSDWDVKLVSGGLMDIEFMVQHGLLQRACELETPVIPNTQNAISALKDIEYFSEDDADELSRALQFQQTVQQVVRMVGSGSYERDEARESAMVFLAACLGTSEVGDIMRAMQEQQKAVQRLWKAHFAQE